MRLRNPKTIVDEIEHLKKEYAVDLFHFTDGVVNRPVKHFEELCLELINRKVEISWTGFLREDSHHQEATEMMTKLLDIHQSAGNLGAVIFNTVRLYPGAPLTQQLIDANLLDSQINLIYPVYHNPVKSAYVLHELEMLCHKAGIYSRLQIESL